MFHSRRFLLDIETKRKISTPILYEFDWEETLQQFIILYALHHPTHTVIEHLSIYYKRLISLKPYKCYFNYTTGSIASLWLLLLL